MAPRSKFKRLLVAPRSVRTGLLEKIQRVTDAAREGKQTRLQIKVNSLVDEEIIDACYRASMAGVQVDVWVRGICTIRPGVEGLSENIRVRSILGRFLEHSRVFRFVIEGEDDIVYIGSADMMHRNLDRRVEALVRITDPKHIETLGALLDEGMSDETSSWHLHGDARWERHHLDAEGTPLRDLQSDLVATYAKRKRKARRR